MGSPSRHLSIGIDRPVDVVYAFAADPLNLPQWAEGLAGADVTYDGEWWITDAPMGRVRFRFVSPNPFGVLDHDVRLPSGEMVHNPMRAIADGDACEIVFTLRQRPGTSDEEFERDAGAVARDLAALKATLEAE